MFKTMLSVAFVGLLATAATGCGHKQPPKAENPASPPDAGVRAAEVPADRPPPNQ